MPFRHDIAGGNGALVITALHSPNFQAGAQGWSVDKDGSAEFNDLTIRGTFLGSDFEVNNAGAFFYSAAPAPDMLSVSVVPGTVTVTDPYGNIAFPGVTFYQFLAASAEYQAIQYYQGTVTSYIAATQSSGWGSGTQAQSFYFNPVTGGTYTTFGSEIIAAQGVYGKTPGSSPPAPDGWIAGNLGNGWVNAGVGTSVIFQYRRVASPPESVEVIGEIDGAAATNAKFFQLPSGYRPASNQFVPAASTSLATAQCFVLCDSAGNLNLQAASFTNRYYFHGFISLDA